MVETARDRRIEAVSLSLRGPPVRPGERRRFRVWRPGHHDPTYVVTISNAPLLAATGVKLPLSADRVFGQGAVQHGAVRAGRARASRTRRWRRSTQRRSNDQPVPYQLTQSGECGLRLLRLLRR
jgi:hypothetical protein